MNKTWDFIIVGAGSAGCVLASTLSENSAVSVLLIEAGRPDSHHWIHVLIGYFKTIRKPATDCCFQTEPVTGLANRTIFWPSGKVVGGSGAINGLIYVRGQSENYDRWQQLGCEGWGWHDVLPYFMRSERQERGPSEFHGNSGPLGVSDNRADFAICDRFVDAAVASGLPRNDDCNDGNPEGVGYYQTTTWNGFRSSTATGYLKPARKRSNLKIGTSALCERILIEQGCANGIAFRRKDGTLMKAYCQREVLLCAGTIRPESRGESRLKSADPAAAPLIRANYLDTENDRRTAIEALKLSREICGQSPLSEVIIKEHAPGPKAVTDQQLLNHVRQTAATLFHPVGTCRMGADPDAVVDPQLRLKGVAGLRVVDASIMPEITSGNTNAPVVMIAEKASDMILANSEA